MSNPMHQSSMKLSHTTEARTPGRSPQYCLLTQSSAASSLILLACHQEPFLSGYSRLRSLAHTNMPWSMCTQGEKPSVETGN